jgi:hypothetical protein
MISVHPIREVFALHPAPQRTGNGAGRQNSLKLDEESKKVINWSKLINIFKNIVLEYITNQYNHFTIASNRRRRYFISANCR